jgi:hypothetical protein
LASLIGAGILATLFLCLILVLHLVGR